MFQLSHTGSSLINDSGHWVHSVFPYIVFPRPLSSLELGVALVHRLAGRPRAFIGAQSGDGEGYTRAAFTEVFYQPTLTLYWISVIDCVHCS